MNLICGEILGLFITRLESLGVPISNEYHDSAISRTEKLLKGVGGVMADERVGKEKDPWCGSYLDTDGTLTSIGKKISFIQWPPSAKGWQVRLEFAEGWGDHKTDPQLPPQKLRGGWKVSLTTTYKGVMQDPPSQEPCTVGWAVKPDKTVYKNEEVHYTDDKLWNPERNKPAKTTFKENGEVDTRRHYVGGVRVSETFRAGGLKRPIRTRNSGTLTEGRGGQVL